MRAGSAGRGRWDSSLFRTGCSAGCTASRESAGSVPLALQFVLRPQTKRQSRERLSHNIKSFESRSPWLRERKHAEALCLSPSLHQPRKYSRFLNKEKNRSTKPVSRKKIITLNENRVDRAEPKTTCLAPHCRRNNLLHPQCKCSLYGWNAKLTSKTRLYAHTKQAPLPGCPHNASTVSRTWVASAPPRKSRNVIEPFFQKETQLAFSSEDMLKIRRTSEYISPARRPYSQLCRSA